jgi:7-carboxy-7-deazaguanine synthase (Cx14CxxC type)
MYATLQGEGFHTGRRAVFLRFAGCNLWSGREVDRASAICQFCDTEFVGTDGPGGGRYANAQELADAVADTWGTESVRGGRFVVATGGEPLLQLDDALIDELHARGFQIAIETNGTLPAPPSIDWVCVSPKAHAPLVQQSGNELKLVFPQPGAEPELYESMAFDHFFLQPMDGPVVEQNVDLTIAYSRARPKWRVSIQSHKYLGIP